MDTYWEVYERGLAKVQKVTHFPEFKFIRIDINNLRTSRWLCSDDCEFQVVHGLIILDVN